MITRISNWIVTNVPAPVRHFIAILFGTIIGLVFQAILVNSGISGLDWEYTLTNSVDGAVVAAIGSVSLLFATPLTNAYGVGKEQ